MRFKDKYPTLEQRFWSKVDTLDPTRCWQWTGSMKANGYGCIRGGTRSTDPMLYAHRAAYELVIGPIPEGMQIDHGCRNRRCVNPVHLHVVTCAENLRRIPGATPMFFVDACPRGHLYDEDSQVGNRRCKTCQAANVRRYKDRLKASRAAGT